MRKTFWKSVFSLLSPKSRRGLCKGGGSSVRMYALRVKPDQDLRQALLTFARQHQLLAGCVVTCVGSLRRAHLRFADQNEGAVLEGRYEIVSLVGTFHAQAGGHFHIALSDEQGRTIGGHLLDGNIVYTTAEIAVMEGIELEFRRELDDSTGYRELKIFPR
ncbi:MAG: DNA-binding protein [Saprospiraceae bacterium]|nr:DNA-binding protein [Saprospiraceae bacterium]MDW8484093.1 DNA-binding protein [Saprospiraceae bacterium]